MEGILQSRDDHYRTSDLYFAAYLRVAQVPLGDTERENGRVVFLFESQGSQVMRELKRQYFADIAKVNVMSFVQAIRTMKALTYSDR